MDKKELLEKHLIDEVEVSSPNYLSTGGQGWDADGVEIKGFHTTKIKQLNLQKLIDLLSKFVKVEDIVE